MFINIIDHIAVMVTGITGVGKSSACNFLMGDDIFEVDLGVMAVTSKSAAHSIVLNSREIKIIDTPGFCEDSKDNKENVEELGKAIILARHGVHAIGIVINASHRFTSSQVTLLKELELLDDLWPFMFIIFSAAKSYGATNEKQRKKVNEIYDNPKCPKDFKKLLDRVEKRFIMLESTETNQQYRATKLKEFLEMVESIYHTNKRLYSNKLFEKAIELYEKIKDKEENREKAYQEALSKAELFQKRMIEEIENMKREQERRMQLMKEEAEAREQMYQKTIKELEERVCWLL